MTNNERYEQDDNLASWESGIRYVEQKQRNKLPKVTRLVVISIVTAIIGGIIGASFMFIKYSNKLNGIEQKILEENSGDRNNRSIMKTAQKIGPSVVGISQTHTTWIDEASDGSLGSGIIFDNRGYIVTNQHIIDGIKNITVTLAGGKRVPGIIVGQDYKSDIAVVKINVENLKAVGFGDSNNLKAGATVIGMGNPLGEEFSGCLTVGVISATNKVIKVDDRTLSLLQTDMTLTKGNSGGAVVSENGDVVGIINNRLIAHEGGSFIIPINDAKPVIEALMKEGKLDTPFLGVKTFLIDDERSEHYNVPKGLGVLDVVEGTTAQKYGIEKGDIILSVSGGKVTKITDITDMLEGKKSGDKVPVNVYRNGKEVVIDAILIGKK